MRRSLKLGHHISLRALLKKIDHSVDYRPVRLFPPYDQDAVNAEAEKTQSLTALAAKGDGRVEIKLGITADRMKIFLEATPVALEDGSFAPVTKDQLLTLIGDVVPGKLIPHEVLLDAAEQLTRGEPSGRRRIAKGLPAVPGKDAKLLVLVKAYQRKSAEFEFIDPWFVRHFDNIEVGQAVARIYPPTAGLEGHDAQGKPLSAAPGKQIEIKIADSLERRAPSSGSTFETLHAKTCGYLEIGKELAVQHELVIAKDLDHRTGDIDFIGKLLVKGNVMKGFRLQARGDIEIQGDVHTSSVHSMQGSIRVNGHVFGDGGQPVTVSDNTNARSLARVSPWVQIQCTGSFSATVVDNATVETFGDIEVTREARNAVLRTRATVRMPKGHLMGGEIHAVCGVEAEFFGTASGTTTQIHLCSDIESSVEFGQLMVQISSHENAEKLLRAYLGPYADEPIRVKRLTGEHRKKIEGMLKKLQVIEQSKAALLKKRDSMLANAHSSRFHRVNVLKKLYPGTEIFASQIRFTTDQPIEGPKTIEFLPESNMFVVRELLPLECILEPLQAPKV